MEDSNSDSGDFNDKSIDSNDNKGTDKNTEKNMEDSSKQSVQKENDDLQDDNKNEFQIESNESKDLKEKNDNENNINNEKDSIVELNDDKNISEKSNTTESSNLNKGNELIFNRRNDLIHIEIDKEKTSQKGYTVYQLNFINNNSKNYNINISIKNNEKKILCFRRYKDFEKFYNTLKIRFPHCIFPRLSEKNYVMAKVRDDPTFIENRRKELQYFINKLYFHEQIGKSEEFKHFISYSTFDEQYYDNLPKKYFYPECEKVNNDKGYWSKGVEKFSSYFSKPKENKQSEFEKNILNREEEFKFKITQYNDLLKEIRILYETSEEEINEYKIISNNLLYLKDNGSSSNSKNEEDINKTKFNELINLTKNLSDILSSNSIDYLSEILDQLNYCILDVGGINRAIERYINFIKEYKKIKEINVKNNKYIIEEKAQADIDKNEFEKSLLDDIQKYDKENKNKYEEIIEKIILFIKNINENNDKAFETSQF